MKQYTPGQSGNVLFLILIAVALFAALSYAVTKSTSGGGNSDNENAKLLAAEVLNYYAAINSAVLRMTLRGIDPVDLCFDDPIWTTTGDIGDYRDNPSCALGDEYKVFHHDGGGVVAKIAPNISHWAIHRISGSVSVESVGTSAPELLMGFMMGDDDYSRKVCDAFNEASGIDPNSAHLFGGTNQQQSWDSFEGNFYAPPRPDVQIIGEDPVNSEFNGRLSGCMHGSSHHGDRYTYYHVFIAR